MKITTLFYCRSKVEYKGKSNNLRDPSLASLDGEECEHGNKAVVVVKVLPVPLPGSHHRRQISVDVLEVHSPEDTFYTHLISFTTQMIKSWREF